MMMTYQVDFGNGGQKKKPVAPSAAIMSRTARMLALAHYIDRIIEDGGAADYAEVARRLGITRARVTQISNLLNLSPRLQESIMSGKLLVSERHLRLVLQHPSWDKQAAVVSYSES